MKVIIENDPSRILEVVNIFDDGTLDVRLDSARAVDGGAAECWEWYAGRYLGGYIENFGSAGYGLEENKWLCSREMGCGGVTREFNVHGGNLWTLRASRSPNVLPDVHGCTALNCKSLVYKRDETSPNCSTHRRKEEVSKVNQFDRIGLADMQIEVSDGINVVSTVQ